MKGNAINKKRRARHEDVYNFSEEDDVSLDALKVKVRDNNRNSLEISREWNTDKKWDIPDEIIDMRNRIEDEAWL